MKAPRTGLTRLVQATLLALLTLPAWLATGCGGTADGEYRAVTDSDIVAHTPATAAADNQPPVSQPPSAQPVEQPAVTPAAAPVVDPAVARTGVQPADTLQPLGPAGLQDGPGLKDVPKVARPIKLLVKERRFQVVGPEKALRVTYDDVDLMRVLNMDPVPADAPDHLPGWLKQLDGKRIRLRGFMFPTFLDPVPFFMLARDNQICCFGRNPKVYDIIPVVMRKGVTSAYIQGRPFDVVATFHIVKKLEEDGLMYKLDDAIVIDK